MKEILRYMGIPENKSDKKLLEITASVFEEIRIASVPKHIIREISSIDIFASESLSSHLKDCSKILVMAATLGTEADRIIRKYLKTDILKASAAQAAATHLIECYCDEITSAQEKDGLHPLPRFSPGYGDFSLEHQKTILDFLEGEKRLGITLTDSLMMIPTKSVTAVIGLSGHTACSVNKCKGCMKKDCQFRKED